MFVSTILLRTMMVGRLKGVGNMTKGISFLKLIFTYIEACIRTGFSNRKKSEICTDLSKDTKCVRGSSRSFFLLVKAGRMCIPSLAFPPLTAEWGLLNYQSPVSIDMVNLRNFCVKQTQIATSIVEDGNKIRDDDRRWYVGGWTFCLVEGASHTPSHRP